MFCRLLFCSQTKRLLQMQIFFAFAKAPFNFCGQNRDFCLWATKKIFLLVFRMNSNSSKNDILLRNMIYGFRRMIYLLRKHDIISVPSYAAGIYHPPKVDIISKIYLPFRKERISLKTPSLYHNEGVFMVETERIELLTS